MLSQEDKDIIIEAINAGGDIWNNKILKPVKAKIKNHHRGIQKESCCYCKKDTQGEFKMVLDIEHILPKSHPKFIEHMFTICNLSVSCKRCNMNIKRTRTDFVFDIDLAAENPCDSNLFKLIHPNSDNYYDHIQYIVEIANDCRLIKYIPVNSSTKGVYTYEFFHLSELEREALDESQGAETVNISDSIQPEIANEIRNLLREK